MNKKESLELFKHGRASWNAWARGMLAERETLEKAGKWTESELVSDWNDVTRDWHLAAEINFKGHQFRGHTDFSNFSFPGHAEFSEATFPGHAGFSGAKFSKKVWFNGATFSSTAGFDKATFSDFVWFDKAMFFGDAVFSGTTFSSNAAFHKATFSSIAKFPSATFSGDATFREVKFSREMEFTEARFSGDAWFNGAAFSQNVGFRLVMFSGDTEFDGATFSNHAYFDGATFSGHVGFSGARFKVAKFDEINLQDADFSKATLCGANLVNADLCRANLNDANLQGANLERADAREARLRNTILRNANLRNVILSKVDLRGADLRTNQMNGADLSWSDLRGAKFNSETRLEGANVEGAKISRYDLACLENYGGLTQGDRMQMHIEDGVALLRATYSGFLQWIHLFALAVFLLPYAWFVAIQWSKARFLGAPDDAWLPLWKALSLFIFNGGVDWHLGYSMHWSFVAFLVLLAYNILRGVLLWKTKSLELQQESNGLPARFALQKNSWSWPWGTLFQLAKWGFYFNLAIVALNSAHFFTQEIPIPRG